MRPETIENILLVAFDGRLGSSFASIDPNLTFEELGLDSMAIIKLLLAIESCVPEPFSEQMLEDLALSPSIHALRDKLVSTYWDAS